MGDSLHEVKRRLSAKYLGRGKIHGVGVREDRNAICLYVAKDDSSEQKVLLQQAAEDAAPYPLLTVSSNQAKIT